MRYVNILWPEELEKEYQRLFMECSDLATDEEHENAAILSAKVHQYIDEHGSQALKEWIAYVDSIKNESA